MQWLDLALSPQGGQITMPEEFRLDQAELTRIWTLFTEESDVKFFRQYVTSFVKSWEEQVSPNWELLVTSTMDGRRVEGPSLSGVLNLSQSRFFSVVPNTQFSTFFPIRNFYFHVFHCLPP